MTKEEAIKYFERHLDLYCVDGISREAEKMAIQALSQEPCDDAISREALIAKLTELIKTSRSTIEIKAKLIPMIQNMPSVTQKSGKWIPVSERLPEAFSFVNCTCHSLIDDREDWVVETCYLPQLPDSPYSDWGNIPMLNDGDCEVVAWMYRDIPEPYKVEPQESEDKE